MRPIFRSLAFGLAAVLSAGAIAQNVVIVTGTVSPCNGVSYPVQIQLNSVPPIDTVVYTGSNCQYSCTLFPVQTQGVVTVTTTCDGGITYMTDSIGYNPFFNTVIINLACGGSTPDCNGVFNGPDMPGTPCDDGDPLTYFDTWSPGCQCFGGSDPNNFITVTGTVIGCTGAGQDVRVIGLGSPAVDVIVQTDANCTYTYTFYSYEASGMIEVNTSCDGGITQIVENAPWAPNATTVVIDLTCGGLNVDCMGILNGPDMPGTPCTIPGTIIQGIWTSGCACVLDSTNTPDCLGIINGPNLPGTVCDDNNPLTSNTVWDANCDCVVSTNPPCEADFWVMQAYTVDSLNPNGAGVPIPNVLWVWNLSSGGNGQFSFLWSFGDGTSSTDPFPTHTYANGGPYLLCLTINDGNGCTDTYCDSISVDDDGMYSGMIVGSEVRSTFTINVINPLTTGVNEQPALDQLATWPNPVTNELNIQLTSRLRGNVNVDILDLSGRTVLAGNHMLTSGANRLSMPTGDLNPGMYLLRIGNGSEAEVLRFVKTR